jgi:hypothetical protein
VRRLGTTLLALVAGFFVGLLLNEVAAIIAHIVFDLSFGIKFLPFIMAGVFAIVVLIWGSRGKSSSR